MTKGGDAEASNGLSNAQIMFGIKDIPNYNQNHTNQVVKIALK